MYITRVKITNIRCFRDIDISFDVETDKIPWTMLIGDNATGKTALLKSIAIGLCDESSAAGLLRESDEGYIRRGSKEPGIILIELMDVKSKETFKITTTIEKVTAHKGDVVTDVFEHVSQVAEPAYHNFPWGKIFACGYGAARGTLGTGDMAGYSIINTVYNLFNYSEGLQNPELSLHRISTQSKKSEEKVLELLDKALFGHFGQDVSYPIALSTEGIVVDGPWGEKMPLRDLADGYRSTMLWFTDFLGWAISYDYSVTNLSDIAGIILIDELEQHLHVKWQRIIVAQLKSMFPRIQFICTTHSPIIASSVGSSDNEHDQLLSLEFDSEKGYTTITSLPTMEYSRFDQVLASRAFEWQVQVPELLALKLARASELLDKGKARSTEEEQEYLSLKKTLLESQYLEASTSIEREIAKEIMAGIEKRIAAFENR